MKETFLFFSQRNYKNTKHFPAGSIAEDINNPTTNNKNGSDSIKYRCFFYIILMSAYILHNCFCKRRNIDACIRLAIKNYENEYANNLNKILKVKIINSDKRYNVFKITIPDKECQILEQEALNKNIQVISPYGSIMLYSDAHSLTNSDETPFHHTSSNNINNIKALTNKNKDPFHISFPTGIYNTEGLISKKEIAKRVALWIVQNYFEISTITSSFTLAYSKKLKAIRLDDWINGLMD